MTDTNLETTGNGHPGAAETALATAALELGPLPLCVTVNKAFAGRLPSQRMLDLLTGFDPLVPFTEIADNQPFRLIAFRALMRDFPGRDPTSLWLHAYDVEVEVEDVDPTESVTRTFSPGSVTSGNASPTTSTT